MRGKHWRGRNILRIRHSIHEHDRMENWGTQLLVLETKSTSLHRLISHEKLKMFSCGVPSSPLKKIWKRLVRLPVLSFRQIAYLGL